MFKTEINLLNKICKTDYFNRLNNRIENIQDYSIIFNEYCDYLMNERYSLLLNEPRINQMNFKFYYEQSNLSDTLFSKFQLNRIQQTIKISNVLVEPFTTKGTYEMVKNLDQELESQAYFLDNTTYSFLDVIVFSSLQKCRIWPKLYKDKTKSKKELPQLIDWYKLFMAEYKQEIEYQFDLSVVTQKYQKKLEKQKKERRLDKKLIEAIRNKDYEMIRKLIEDGSSDIESIDQNMYKKPAHIACELGDVELCRFIDQYDCDWESLDTEEQTPIFYAVQSENLDVVKFLVNEKQVNHQHKEYQHRTPFYLACFIGNMPIIEFLYEKGVNINEPSKLKRCALSKACYLGHVDVVQFLVSKPEIDITLADSKGRTAMHNAAWGIQGGKEGKRRGTIMLPDSCESIEILLNHGHPIDFLDFEGNSSLISAASSDGRDSVRVLINRGANRNIQNMYGETPLFLAAKFGHIEILKQLIEQYNVDWQIKDYKNTTPCEIAGVQQNYDCFDYLLDLELKSNSINVENFLEKLNDDYILPQDQMKIFEFYNKKINFVNHIKDVNKIINLFKTCKNGQLMLNIYSSIIHLLDQSHAKQFFIVFANQSQYETAFSLLQLYNKYQNSIINENKELNKQKQQSEIIIEPELIYNYIQNSQQNISDEIINKFLFEINSDWIHYIHPITNNTFLHLLTEQRRMKTIVDFLEFINKYYNHLNNIQTEQSEKKEQINIIDNDKQNIVNEEIVSKEECQTTIDINEEKKLSDDILHTIQNKYLIEDKNIYKQEFIKQYFSAGNNNDLNCLDICLLQKCNDIHLIIDNFLRTFLHEEPSSHYIIPKYTLEILPARENYEKKQLEEEVEWLQEQIKTKSDYIKQQNYYNINNQNKDILKKQLIDNNIPQAQQLQINETNKTIEDYINKRKFIFISNIKDDQDNIKLLQDQINKHDIFGIDLEYYCDSKDENIGFVCTIQISTIEMDIVLDGIQLRDELNNLLNDSLFLNKNKIKVLHGCDNDIQWLKNDFNIDIYNLFDTMKAEMILKNKQQSFSLKNICLDYLGIELDKSFQQSDWRIRPIPQLMMSYARIDSFILISLYFIMKDLLKERQLINQMYLGCLKIIIKKVEKNNYKNILLKLL